MGDSTRDDSSISSRGWTWAIICCFCGSWIASCLVNCLPGFRKYTHSCPNCNALIREVEPNHKTYHKIILAVAVLLVIAPLAFLFFVNLRIKLYGLFTFLLNLYLIFTWIFEFYV